jgi:hypothetical protein
VLNVLCVELTALGGDANKEMQAEAVNDGIVYLMVIPLVALIGYAVYRMKKRRLR